MILKNYTTNKNYIHTITEIEKLLVGIGAKKILKDYDNSGFVTALSFTIQYKDQDIPIKLPARIERIPAALRHHFNDSKDVTSAQRSLLRKAMEDPERARNIGWRIIQDWLLAQVAIMQLDQINMIEALLPFTMWGKDKTLYELLESQEFNMKKVGTLLLENKGDTQNT